MNVVLITRPGVIQRLDLNSGKLETVHIGHPEFCMYGLTWSEQHMFIGQFSLARGATVDRITVTDGSNREDMPVNFHQTHQIHYAPNLLRAPLLCAVSALNAVAMVSSDGTQGWLRPNPHADGIDVNHVNSVWESDGKTHVVSHNFGRSTVDVFDTKSLKKLVSHNVGYDAHNVFNVGGRLCVCSSDTSDVRSTGSDEVVAKFENDWYPRGVATDGKHVATGLSKKGVRTSRKDSPAQLSLLESHKGVLKEVHRYDLGNFGGVHEVRALHSDKAHNQLPCPLFG